MNYRPVVLTVLDGWGIGPNGPGNAILAAHTPTMDRLQAQYPWTQLNCSGRDVGLPTGQMGNSEVGHLNLGAGFVVYQWITRIDAAIEDGPFFENPVLLAAVDQAKERGTSLHLMGLIGNGGVHAYQEHLIALLDLAHRRGLRKVYIHAFMDGRDTPPTSGLGFMTDLLADIDRIGVGRVATVSGRYYAMDRDRRWERTRKAYEAIVDGIGNRFPDPLSAIQTSYDSGVTDEFMLPAVMVEDDGKPVAELNAGDSVILFNFRADRARQLTNAIAEPAFAHFTRSKAPQDLYVATLTEYEKDFPVHVAFEQQDIECPLARVISDAGKTQLHAAETEKYPHVTYFFNGGREDVFPGEERLLVPSPKVATYDLQPEMSAPELTDGVVTAIESGKYDFIVVNFANGDMVGHTGVFEAAVKAVETVNSMLQRILTAALSQNGVILVTADHGNAEEMLIPGTNQVWTAHSKNPVPFIVVSTDDSSVRHASLRSDGRLADVAPTVLALMGLEAPKEMTGHSLIERPSQHSDER